jgi:hypothetical protein
MDREFNECWGGGGGHLRRGILDHAIVDLNEVDDVGHQGCHK